MPEGLPDDSLYTCLAQLCNAAPFHADRRQPQHALSLGQILLRETLCGVKIQPRGALPWTLA
jgi:hypothetical protein